MTSDNSKLYDEIQPSDHSAPEEAVANNIAAKAREYEWQLQKERAAKTRELLRATYAAFIGVTDYEPGERLAELQAYLDESPRLEDVLAPDFDDLEPRHKRNYRKFARQRNRQRNGADVTLPIKAELETYVAVAIAVGNIHAATDFTRMAPVTLEKLEIPGARSPIEGDPSPVGRRLVGAGSTRDLEDAAIELPHVDCEHVLVIANPRAGKDALLTRLAGNLKDEHGYKWVSLHDDGRNETPMVAIPNDEDAIRQSLERFGQEPKGYPTKVYVPAIDLPDRLPRNFVPFTFGVDALTPEVIGHLSGVSPSGGVEERIKYALRDAEGSVDELIRLLDKYADETSLEVTVTALRDDLEEGEEVESQTRTYEMGEEKILRDCSQSLMMLASEGLLQDAGAETNLDVVDLLQDQEHVAVLNCNTLPIGDGHLKMLIENVWLRLIHQARDEHPWLPRVAVEMREIKQLAPSVLERTKYSKIAKSLRQTVFHLSSQGGSRRIMMLGSTQYLRDVYLPVRGNMPIKVLLKMGEEKIKVLENAGFGLSEEQKQQLRGFDPGWGMIMTPEGKEYPINWSGPKCGLGLGDLPWHVRYGRAMGFRVDSESVADTQESWKHDSTHYYTQDGEQREAPPDRAEWYLLPSDIEAIRESQTTGVDDELVLEAATARQEYELEQDLRFTDVDVATEQREIELLATSEAEAREEKQVFQEYNVDGVLRSWAENRQLETVEKMVLLLEAVDKHQISTYSDLEAETGISEDSVKVYGSTEDMLKPCLEKTGDYYRLTLIGQKALEVPWRQVFDEL